MMKRELYFDCNKGWHPIIKKLLTDIVADPVPVKVLQIKEKFGGLRFYYDGGSEYTAKLVQAAEEECSRTCEFCGEPGEKRNLRWIRTLCDKHYEEEKKRFESIKNE